MMVIYIAKGCGERRARDAEKVHHKVFVWET
jgi:hypothetical protein